MKSRFLAVGIALILMLGGVASPVHAVADDAVNADDDVKLTPLHDSLAAIKERFNDHREKIRFIALLSPT